MVKVERSQRKFRESPPCLIRIELCTQTRKKRTHRLNIIEYLNTADRG